MVAAKLLEFMIYEMILFDMFFCFGCNVLLLFLCITAMFQKKCVGLWVILKCNAVLYANVVWIELTRIDLDIVWHE